MTDLLDELIGRVDEFHEGTEGFRPVDGIEFDDEGINDGSNGVSDHSEGIPDDGEDVGLDIVDHVDGESVESTTNISFEKKSSHRTNEFRFVEELSEDVGEVRVVIGDLVEGFESLERSGKKECERGRFYALRDGTKGRRVTRDARLTF